MSGEAGISTVNGNGNGNIRFSSPSGLGDSPISTANGNRRLPSPSGLGDSPVNTANGNRRLPNPSGLGPTLIVDGNAPWNRPTSCGPELNVICRTADLPVFIRSPYQQYDRIVVLREPKHALVPSGARLSAEEYVVSVGASLLIFNK